MKPWSPLDRKDTNRRVKILFTPYSFSHNTSYHEVLILSRGLCNLIKIKKEVLKDMPSKSV